MNTLTAITLNSPIKTNWYVVTGGPSTGKTMVINLLHKRGYQTAIEHARHYIDTQKSNGQTVEEIRENKRKFQLRVLDMQVEQENSLSRKDVVFLDRAIPDALAYYQFLELDYDKKLIEAINNVSYKKIFILDTLPFVNDYARTEDKTAQEKIHFLITKVYESLSFPVVQVPVLSPEVRVDFILKNL
ncbi:MAG: AAA family ATPase [Lutibacter sp.]